MTERGLRLSSCCMNFCGHMKVSPIHLTMKWVKLSFSRYFVSIIFGCPTLLGCCKMSEELMLHHLPTEMEFSRRLTYHVKATPLSNCTKSCNNSLSFVDGGPFTTEPHCTMKWKMHWLGFFVSLNILNSGILKLTGKSFNPSRIRCGDRMGHSSLSFLLRYCWLIMSEI